MAKLQAFTMFLGQDFQCIFTIKNRAETACIDVSTYAMSFMVKRTLDDPDSAKILAVTTAGGIVVSGTFHSDPDTNTQVVTVTLLAAYTDDAPRGECQYELKRTDSGSETPLAYGPVLLKRGVHRT